MSYNPAFEASKAVRPEALAKKLEDFEATGQDLSRRRFSYSPTSPPSASSTEWDDSQPASPRPRLHDQERKEMKNSTAEAQFAIQIRDEEHRIQAAREKGLLQQSTLFYPDLAAIANVTLRWKEQGIWDPQWEEQLSKTWKHEVRGSRPLVRPSKPRNDDRVTVSRAKRKWQPRDVENELAEAAQHAIESQNRQLSRPCYQFVYQFVKEREWIKMGLSRREDQEPLASLDTRAYQAVKARWKRDKILG